MFTDQSYIQFAKKIIFHTGELGEIRHYKESYKYAFAARTTIKEASIEEHAMKSPFTFDKKQQESFYEFLSYAVDFKVDKENKANKPYHQLMLSLRNEIEKKCKKEAVPSNIGTYDFYCGSPIEKWGEKNALKIIELYEQMKLQK